MFLSHLVTTSRCIYLQNNSNSHVGTSPLFNKIHVQVGNDQENAQSDKVSTPKTEVGKTKLAIRYLYHETYRKTNEQLFSQ